MSATSTQRGGVSLIGALFLVFLILKLTGVIAWSWWWITAPLWISSILWFLVLAATVIVIAFIAFYRTKKRATK